MSTPQVSINIPVYNINPELIIRCLNSLKSLNKDKYEIILINDGSNIECKNFLLSIENKYENLKIIHQENIGLAATRNEGIKNSNGKYIFFLDADDWINPSEFLDVLKVCENNDLDVCGFGYQKINDKFETISTFEYNFVNQNFIYTGVDLLDKYELIISSWAYLFKKQFILENELYFIQIYSHEDVEHFLRVFIKAKKIILLNKIVYNYFLSDDSITRTNNVEKVKRYLFETIDATNIIMKNISNDYLINKIIRIYSNSIIWNLLWRFISKPKEVDFEFKMKCIADLKKQNLYPIKGALKTNFQKLTTLFFNQEWLLKIVLKIQS